MNYTLKPRTVRVAIDGELGIFDTQTRFDICGLDGTVIDDAQGYGYKSAQAAHKAAAYKFKGGRQKTEVANLFWRKNPDFAKKLADVLLINFKTPPSDAALIAFATECGIPDFNPAFIKALPSR